MMESISTLDIEISPEIVESYTQLAKKHLEEQVAVLEVSCAGVDESGSAVFGICMRSVDGQEDWYDPGEAADSIIGWSNKQDASTFLKKKVLPNLGYAVLQRDIQLFHMNMTND